MAEKMQKTSSEVVSKMARRYDDGLVHKHDKSKGKHYRRHQKTYLSNQFAPEQDAEGMAENDAIFAGNLKCHSKRVRNRLNMKKSRKKLG